MAKALINPEMLSWARERAGLTIDALAKKLNKYRPAPDQVQAWEHEEEQPTFKQAETIARITQVPFGYLFLPEPPQEELPIPDLRTQRGSLLETPSADFLDLIRDISFQQNWYRDYRLEQGAEPLPFIGKFKLDNKVQAIAEDIRTILNLDAAIIKSNWEDHFNALCDRCEELGIWIMRAGYVGSNTHRTLDTAEFSGFAISDPIAPLIFINGRDAKARQIFTLAHELAHIWLGESGVSNLSLDDTNPGQNARVERVCNAVAAEVLAPESRFLAHWNDRETLDGNVIVLTSIFKVSGIVIARRAFDLDKVDWKVFQTFYKREQKRWHKEGGSGGNYYATVPIKNGRKYTSAVLSRAMSGQLLLRDAGTLLHMKPATVQKLFYRQQQGWG